MSSNLMDTEPGGESTQYESINTVNKPHAKEAGQLGATSQKTKDLTSDETPGTIHNASGSAISTADDENGSAGKSALETEDEEEAKSRRVQGYGGEKDMRRDVGA